MTQLRRPVDLASKRKLPVDPALQRFIEALARADARRDYREAEAREGSK